MSKAPKEPKEEKPDPKRTWVAQIHKNRTAKAKVTFPAAPAPEKAK